MTIKYELTSLKDFDFWCGAKYAVSKILESGKETEALSLLADIFPNGCSETELNDFFWFDDEEIFEILGIPSE